MAFGLILLLCLVHAPAFARAPEQPRPRWDERWRRVAPWEFVAVPLALGGAVWLRFRGPNPDADVRGGVLFDDWVIDRLGMESADNHLIAKRAADAVFYGALIYRGLDSTLVPLVAYGDADLTLQMSMIDLEAFTTLAVVLWTAQLAVGRERPVVSRRCSDPSFLPFTGECNEDDDDRNRSFIAGHPAAVMTAAGLTCQHHGHLRTYGGAGDTLACGVMIGAAAMTGLGRMMTEDHYPTDVALGLAVGAASGWLVPALLHYGFAGSPAARAPRAARPAVRAAILPLPWVVPAGLGLELVGFY